MLLKKTMKPINLHKNIFKPIKLLDNKDNEPQLRMQINIFRKQKSFSLKEQSFLN